MEKKEGLEWETVESTVAPECWYLFSGEIPKKSKTKRRKSEL